MPVLTRITVPNPDDILAGYGAGALVRIERAATEDGAYTEIDTFPVVITAFSYEVWDATGTTSSWYRTRYSGTDTPTPSTTFSEYSDPFTAGEPAAYANLDDVLMLFDTPPAGTTASGTKKLARLEQLLGVATDELIHEMGGIDYRRHPLTSGNEARTFTVSEDGVIHIHEGVLSIDSARIRRTRFDDFEAIDVDDLQLEYWAGGDPRLAAVAGEPFDHVTLTGRGSLTIWPRTAFGVELTGAYGWSPAPRLLREITVERTRQLAYADPSYSGIVPGDPEYGGGPIPMRWPQTLYTFMQTEKWRHIGCSI